MTEMVKRSYEEIYKNLKNTDLMAKSAEKTKELQKLGTLSNPNNRQNINGGFQLTSSIHTKGTNSQPCTSTPKNQTTTHLHDNSSASKSAKSNAMLDSGFQSHNESSYLNSSYNIFSTNSSFNQSLNSLSGDIPKLETTKGNDSRTSKPRRKSPSSFSRNRLKAKANNFFNNQSFSKPQNKDDKEENNSSLTVVTKNNINPYKSNSPLSNLLDQRNQSQQFNISSTHTSKTLNQTANESSSELDVSLVTAYSRVSLSNPTKLSQSQRKPKWQERVDMDSFTKTINKMLPPKGSYPIGSKIGVDKYDIIGNVFTQNVFDFTTKLFSHLSNDDLLNFYQVSTTWKMNIEWHPAYNQKRKDHLKSMHTFYKLNKENISQTTKSFLSPTTSKHIPLQFIQMTSQVESIKGVSDMHDVFQKQACQLLNHQTLTKCPRCSWASRVDGLKALCTKASCGLQFCSLCLRSDHPFGVICPQQTTH